MLILLTRTTRTRIVTTNALINLDRRSLTTLTLTCLCRSCHT